MAATTLFQQSLTSSNVGNATAFSFGLQFSLSQAVHLAAFWWYSPPGADALPDACAVYAVSGQSQVSGTLLAPSWSGAAGSGWVRAAYASPPSLASGTQYAAVVHGKGTSAGWYGRVTGYWTTGAGASGITSGPATAPSNTAAANGQQPTLAGAAIGYPTGAGSGSNYLLDFEVTTASTASGAAALTAPGSVTPTAVRGVTGASHLTAPAGLAAAATGTVHGAAALAAAAGASVTGHCTAQGGLALAAGTALGAAPGVTVLVSAALGADPSAVADALASSLAGASLASGATLSAAAAREQRASCALSAPGTTAATGSVTAVALAALRAGPVLSAAPVRDLGASASLAAVAALSAVIAGREVQGAFSGTASAVLACSYLSARIVMAANTIFPANQSGTYGAAEPETTVTVPGVTDGIYT